MKRYLMKRLISIALSAASVVSLMVPIHAENETASFSAAAFYNSGGALVGVRAIKGALTDDEIDVLVDAYTPDSAVRAKVLSWTDELKSVDGSERAIDLSGKENTVTILHTNDMHGSLIGSGSVIGSDRVASLKKMEDAILADGGDATQGVALASLTHGADVIDIMSIAGYDVMAAGNHEFDYGLDILGENILRASFPIISANTYYDEAPLFMGEYNGGITNGKNIIIEKNGIKVGMFALTTVNAATSTKPDGIIGVEFRDEIETAKEQVKYLDEQGADVIIAITHMGVLEDVNGYTSRYLADAMADTGLDAIIDGHSHTVVNETEDDGVVIGQTGTANTYVGRMEITVDEDGEVSVDEKLLSRAFFENIEPDAATAAKIAEINKKQSGILGEVIGETQNTLWGGSINQIAEARVGETNLGNLICDSMIYSVKQLVSDEYADVPIIAVENGGGFRASIANGTITNGSVVDTLPFANTVRFKEITPSVLYDYLETSIAPIMAQNADNGLLTSGYSGEFPQIGGFSFEYDPNAESGAKVKRVILGDTELKRDDAAARLIIASNDYVMTKEPFADIPTLGEGSGLEQALSDYINYLTENGTKPLAVKTAEGRIKTVGAYEPSDYTAHIQLTGNVPAEGTEITVYIDSTTEITGTVTGNGILDITVADGPHAVKLVKNQHEVYVNNYSGNGVIEEYGDWKAGYPVLDIN